jgi:hypothetical protein
MYMYIVLNLDQCVTLFDHAVFIIVKYQKNVQSNLSIVLSIVVTWGRLTKWPLYTGDLYMKGFDFSTKYCTLVVNKHFSLHLMFLIMFYCDVGKSCRAVDEEMGVGRAQIMNILKRKREILDDCENNVSSSTSCYWKL